MSASIYNEKLVEPNGKMLTYDLAEAKSHPDKIAEFIESGYGDFIIKQDLFEAKKYAEGRTIQIEVKT